MTMAENRYATKKKGPTKGYPFWNMEDIKKMIDYFRNNQLWNDYLKFMLLFLFGRKYDTFVNKQVMFAIIILLLLFIKYNLFL